MPRWYIPMANRAQVVATARSFKGTPFKHQGRIPGRGLDCAGVINTAANLCAIVANFNFTRYSHFPRPEMVRRELTANLDLVAGGIAAARPGDVLWLADHGYATHMGIVGDGSEYLTVIHSSRRDGGVIESIIDAQLARDVRGVFAFRGIE
jgi:cell wall-associated NlpC family hydrolase